MTDLDELRRIAYGRTTSPADEEAAATARVALADHAAEQQRAAERRAAEQRAEEQRAEEQRAAELGGHPEQPQNETHHQGAADEPGRLRRLASARRVWAVPAAAAFVVGSVLAGASVYLFVSTTPDDTIPRTAPDYALVDPYAEGTLAIPSGPVIPGDLAAAELAFARPQSQGDALEVADSSIDASSVRLITSLGTAIIYAARTVDAQLCLVVLDRSQQFFDATATSETTIRTCATPEVFATQGLSFEISDAVGGRERMHWNGGEVSTFSYWAADASTGSETGGSR